MLNENDLAPFADFFRAVYPRLVSRMGTRLGDPAAGEDVVQEALVRAWERTRSGAAIASLPGWITAAALNLGRDRWRRQRAEEKALWRLAASDPGQLEGVVPPEPEDGPSELALHVAALPRRQREVVLLHYFADMRVEDVAAALGVGEGTVKQCLFRARRHLQRALAATEPPTAAVGTVGRGARPTTPTERHAVNGVKGWIKTGSRPQEYEHGIAADERPEGKRVAFLRCTADAPTGFGTVMQMVAADHYRGKRLRFSGRVRSAGMDGADDWAGLWMRVDGPAAGTPLAFDNMQNSKRAITGTTDWRSHHVVLDVAAEARAIGLGVLLSGAGEVRVADLRFEEVGPDVPVTNVAPRELPKRPQNLDLSED